MTKVKDRYCKICGKKLSMYNTTNECFHHKFKESKTPSVYDDIITEPQTMGDRGASFRKTYRQYNG